MFPLLIHIRLPNDNRKNFSICKTCPFDAHIVQSSAKLKVLTFPLRLRSRMRENRWKWALCAKAEENHVEQKRKSLNLKDKYFVLMNVVSSFCSHPKLSSFGEHYSEHVTKAVQLKVAGFDRCNRYSSRHQTPSVNDPLEWEQFTRNSPDSQRFLVKARNCCWINYECSVALLCMHRLSVESCKCAHLCCETLHVYGL